MGIVKRIYGRDGEHSTCYLTRVKLTPNTRWGQLYFHIFHRADLDRDFHDHPYDFWTFPLRTYYERVLDLSTGRDRLNAVGRFRWHFRLAEYAHTQLGAARFHWIESMPGAGMTRVRENVFGSWTATLVFHKPARREWGFWLPSNAAIIGPYFWVNWRKYLFS